MKDSRDELFYAISRYSEWACARFSYEDRENLADFLYKLGFRLVSEEAEKEMARHKMYNFSYNKQYAVYLDQCKEKERKRTAREICFLLDNEEETKRKTIEKIEEKYGAGKWILTKIKSQ